MTLLIVTARPQGHAAVVARLCMGRDSIAAFGNTREGPELPVAQLKTNHSHWPCVIGAHVWVTVKRLLALQSGEKPRRSALGVLKYVFRLTLHWLISK